MNFSAIGSFIRDIFTSIDEGDYFSVFLGFCSALLAQAVISKVQVSIYRFRLLRNIKEELASVKNDTREYIDQKAEPVLKAYTIPIWESTKGSKDILSLGNLKCYKDILIAYDAIEQANSIENEGFQITFQGGQLTAEARTVIDAFRKELLKTIDDTLNSINNTKLFWILFR